MLEASDSELRAKEAALAACENQCAELRARDGDQREQIQRLTQTLEQLQCSSRDTREQFTSQATQRQSEIVQVPHCILHSTPYHVCPHANTAIMCT